MQINSQNKDSIQNNENKNFYSECQQKRHIVAFRFDSFDVIKRFNQLKCIHTKHSYGLRGRNKANSKFRKLIGEKKTRKNVSRNRRRLARNEMNKNHDPQISIDNENGQIKRIIMFSSNSMDVFQHQPTKKCLDL